MPPVYYFPATLAILFRSDSWLGSRAIASTLRSYGRSGQEFWLKSRRPGDHHYHVVPGDGGFYVRSGPMSELTSVKDWL